MTINTIDPATLGSCELGSSNSSEEFPIMSISKSFCGVTCSLMAAEGKFGEKGLNSTLVEVLENKKQQLDELSPQSQAINNYLNVLNEKDLSQMTIGQILNHRHQGQVPDTMLAPEEAEQYLDGKLRFFQDKLPTQEQKPTNNPEFSYSNTAYELLEEVINLTSDKGGYLQELESRVFQPLNLNHTTTVMSSDTAMSNVGSIDCPEGFRTPYGKTYDTNISYNPLQLHPGQKGSIAAGALSSNIDDMTIYSTQLAKMITGQNSQLTQGMSDEQKDMIKSSYMDFRGKDNPGQNYSLGVAIMEDEDAITIAKGGRFPGNKANMVVKCPKNEDNSFGEPEIVDLYMQTRPFVIDSSPFSGVNHQYQNALKDYFKEKNPELAESFLEGNEQGNHWRAKLNNWRDQLMQNGQLPENFAEIQEQCCDVIAKTSRAIDPKLRTKDQMDKFSPLELKNMVLDMKGKFPSSDFTSKSAESEFISVVAKGYGVSNDVFKDLMSDKSSEIREISGIKEICQGLKGSLTASGNQDPLIPNQANTQYKHR